MPRNQKISALVMVAAALLGMVYTFVAGNRPLLGLDLQGGVSVVLQPTEPATEEALDQTISIIRNRVDALGVAEPEISRQGDNIVVDLPGVQEQQRALELVGQTAELRFRPVIFTLAPPSPAGTTGEEELPGTDPLDEDAEADDAGTETDTTDTTAGAGTPSTEAPPAPEEAPAETTVPAEGEESLATPGGRFGARAAAQGGSPTTGPVPPEPPTTEAPGTEPPTTEAPGTEAPATEGEATETPAAEGEATETPAAEGGAAEGEQPAPEATPAQQAALDACLTEGGATVTPPEQDEPEAYVLLSDETGTLYCLGPTLLTGEAIETAIATPLSFGEWEVRPTFRSGESGIDLFNAAAALCYNGDPDVCPTRALAIVLDHQVVVAPQINAPSFARDVITITGGFGQGEAQDVATVLRYGALPVELAAQQTRTVSATIGEDALDAGVIAGIVGLIVVALYLVAYYRLAGLVVIGGLAISGMLLWTIIAWFGETQGLALTTAGIVGIIVSIGVSADSNIVYFENVKDALRGGRTVRTSIERAYRNSISTIVKADVVALIAAVLLYWLTVGAVRGFAFYLGLATLLDLLVAWFFMRPALNWMATNRIGRGRPSRLGLATAPAGAGGAA